MIAGIAKYGFVLAVFNVSCVAASAQIIGETKHSLQSPDKNISIEFYLKKLTDSTRGMYYTVSYKGKEVILESDLDIQLDNHLSEQAMALRVDHHAKWCENLKITGVETATTNTSWKPLYGERSEIRDNHNDLIVHLVKDDNPIYKMDVEIRAYNEGAAIRYFFPENEKGTYYRIMGENTSFSLPQGTKAWFAGWAQAPYHLLPLKDWPQESERPLTLELGNGLYACLAEARMTDYARTKFKLSTTKENTILTSMYTPADLISPIGTPWRVIMVGEKPSDLVEHNYIIQNLNPPSLIKDPSWIKPGKIMRVMTQTTKDAKENIDFAAKHNLQYILFDWKWYGPAFTFTSDVTKVVAPLDMPEIVRYGKEKGVGVWLYVNLQGLYSQSDSLFAIYHKWGIKGVKFGFVQIGSHRWTTWVEEMIKKAAENEIMVNIHDDWRPTGEQRTYPNLMTAEGIRGNEEMPEATHNTVLPFTRFIAGASDYTLCYYDKRIKTTHAHQLAMAAVYYSPIQTLYWYDKPAMSNNEPELEFWDKIPTVWDDTKILAGQPGEYVTTARRSGNTWFVGTLNNNDARKTSLSFNFLPKGKEYMATIFSDDDTVATATKVKVEKRKVNAATMLDMQLKASGGQAVLLELVK
ncbi:glycoside hydrolase family 97 catalytic domain-containing protein [Parasediminibacterium sp. JCM 36343]|uniref:glycoside hydrolase family 97 protein n=1 Tax=Parasediminibacterium sp. JCM 36343 TaxID=3374279 RepID=UPI00397CA98C